MKFTIAIMPSGKMIFATEEDLNERQLADATAVIDEWRHSDEEGGTLVVPNAKVVLIEDVEFQIVPQSALPH